jgi:predicted lipoprotein with Yx(FWY)xxD motif/cytochrome c5
VARTARLSAIGLSLLTAGVLLAGAQGSGEGAVLAVAENTEVGAHIVDGEGRSLYLFLSDRPEGGEVEESVCYDRCAETWPPLLTEGEDAASLGVGEGVDASLVGVLERRDGTFQVTYAGWPLYYFDQDEQPQDVGGQGRGGVWYLVTPGGSALQGESAQEAPDSAEVALLYEEGAAVYARICAACHAVGGTGGQGPALVNNPRLEDAEHVLDVILHGFGYMPPFRRQLSDREVAAAATYVRASWGNDYPPVTEEEAANMR